MKITLINGQNHKGSTYHIARMVAEKIGGEIEEFFLPKDLNEGCFGCYRCLDKGREHCPHAGQIERIFNSMLSADVIIIGSPTYVLEMTGHLKNLFDHLFTAWLPHRPEAAMFSKTAVVVSTAAGIGMNNVVKSLSQQIFYLGVPKVYKLPFRVAATSWDNVKIKDKVNTAVNRTVKKITAKNGEAKPTIKLKLMFSLMRLSQKNNGWALLDRKHWEERNWLGAERPWK